MDGNRIAGRLVPSIGDVLFLSIFLRTLTLGNQLLNDGDTGWHIRVGDGILGSLRIPVSDALSHTALGAPWTDHEWLSEVIFSIVHRLIGLNGVVLLSATVISLTFFMLYKYMLRRGVGPLHAAFFTLVAVSASSGHWLARPHIFTLSLALAFTVILESYQREGKDRLMLLPVLMAAWVNLHAGFMLGLILILIYTGGNLLVSAGPGEDKDVARKKARRLGIIALLSFLACLINPRGPAVFEVAVKLTDSGFIMDNIKEWSYPDFHVEKGFEFMLLAYITVFVMSRKRPDIFEGATALMLLHMSLFAVRFAPLMAVVVTPMAASRAPEALGNLAGNIGVEAVGKFKRYMENLSSRVALTEGRFKGHAWVYVSVLACLVISLNGGTAFGAKVMDYGFDKRIYPVDALDFAVKNGIRGNMFNNYGWGGYILYAAPPDFKVFIDGRIEPYGTEVFKDYLSVEKAKPAFEDVLDKYRVDWVIYNAGSPVNRILVKKGWRLVYSDGVADIVVRDSPENRVLTLRHADARFVE